MQSVRDIKRRIRSVRNTSQITKAMEVVAATKMRRSQMIAISARPYAIASLEILHNLLRRSPALPPLLTPRKVKTAALVVITSDKGLAGSFNANVLRKAENWMQEHESYVVVTVGKKAREYFERKGSRIARSFSGFGDFTKPAETWPIASFLIDGFLSKEWDTVEAVYANFKSTLLQEPVMKRILPITKRGIEDVVKSILPERGRYAQTDAERFKESRYSYEYTFEPSATDVLEALVGQLIRVHIHHIVLESNASEHSARMIAMKNASDNAKNLINDLTLVYNKVRQAGITRELTEITAGKEALE